MIVGLYFVVMTFICIMVVIVVLALLNFKLKDLQWAKNRPKSLHNDEIMVSA